MIKTTHIQKVMNLNQSPDYMLFSKIIFYF